MKFAVYIPARNVEKTLEEVIRRLPKDIKESAQEIIVVDNASADATCEIASGLPVTLLRNKDDLGYGGSQKKAYEYCLNRGYETVIMVHGDGQYAPELAGDLLTKLQSGNYSMVFGSRMRGNPLRGGMPLYRYIANIFLTQTGNLLLGTKLSEFHSGYRVYRLDALLAAGFEELTSDYHFDTEIIVRLRERNFPMSEIPIPTHYGQDSKSIGFFHSVWYGLNVIRAVALYRLRKVFRIPS